jgi:hypothetical protein
LDSRCASQAGLSAEGSRDKSAGRNDTVNFFGFVAKIGPGTTILLEQEPVADNLWLPKRFSMHVNASAFGFLDESSTDDETYRDYNLLPKTSAGLVLSRDR